MKFNKITFLILIINIFFVACRQKYTPKPKGYFRFDLPTKKYIRWDKNYPFSFDVADITSVTPDKSKGAEKYWLNINYPQLNATLHLSYKRSNSKSMVKYLEDARKLAYKHSIKADAISEQAFHKPSENVHALIYRMKGDAASSIQFVVADSNRHFLRGALYFKAHPNQDSLAPAIKYINSDIVRLIESLKWEH